MSCPGPPLCRCCPALVQQRLQTRVVELESLLRVEVLSFAEMRAGLERVALRNAGYADVARQRVTTLETRVAELEAEKARMRDWLDLKDLSEDAPRARETIRSLRTRIAELEAACDEFDARYDAGVKKYRERALAAESRLAEARTALREAMTSNPHWNGRERLTAALSASPAPAALPVGTPEQRFEEWVDTHPDNPNRRTPAPAATAEAEAKVLDACEAASLCDDDPDADPLEPQEHGENCYLYTDDQHAIAKAELARRAQQKEKHDAG